MDNDKVVKLLLLPKMRYALLEIHEIAILIQELELQDEQWVIDYEDILNKFSVLDYEAPIPDVTNLIMKNKA